MGWGNAISEQGKAAQGRCQGHAEIERTSVNTKKSKGRAKVKLARKNPVGMGSLLLIRIADHACLCPVDTAEGHPFKVWSDKDGIDLYWKGRRVESVYSPTDMCWRSVPVVAAARALLKRGDAVRVKSKPGIEGFIAS